jgi:hypothetical protein
MRQPFTLSEFTDQNLCVSDSFMERQARGQHHRPVQIVAMQQATVVNVKICTTPLWDATEMRWHCVRGSSFTLWGSRKALALFGTPSLLWRLVATFDLAMVGNSSFTTSEWRRKLILLCLTARRLRQLVYQTCHRTQPWVTHDGFTGAWRPQWRSAVNRAGARSISFGPHSGPMKIRYL